MGSRDITLFPHLKFPSSNFERSYFVSISKVFKTRYTFSLCTLIPKNIYILWYQNNILIPPPPPNFFCPRSIQTKSYRLEYDQNLFFHLKLVQKKFDQSRMIRNHIWGSLTSNLENIYLKIALPSQSHVRSTT